MENTPENTKKNVKRLNLAEVKIMMSIKEELLKSKMPKKAILY